MVPRLVFGCILLMVVLYVYFRGKSLMMQRAKAGAAGCAAKQVGVYSVKQGDVWRGYLYGNKKKTGDIEVFGYSTPNNGEFFLMTTPKTVGFRDVSLEDTGDIYDVAKLHEALENNGAFTVSDTVYLVDKSHTKQWVLS